MKIVLFQPNFVTEPIRKRVSDCITKARRILPNGLLIFEKEMNFPPGNDEGFS